MLGKFRQFAITSANYFQKTIHSVESFQLRVRIIHYRPAWDDETGVHWRVDWDYAKFLLKILYWSQSQTEGLEELWA